MYKIDFFIDFYLRLPIKIWKVLYFSWFFPLPEALNRNSGEWMEEWLNEWLGEVQLHFCEKGINTRVVAGDGWCLPHSYTGKELFIIYDVFCKF